MTRRSLVALALLSVVGGRRLDRHNRHCARKGATLTRHGLSDRERERLERAGCKEENGEWMSGLFWEA